MATPKEKLGKGLFAILRPGKYMQAQADQKSADEQVRNAERLRREGMDLAQQLNWEPHYASDLIGPYQKTQSPVARSFLESLLTGANPSMVSSTRHGAPRLQAGAQARFDDQFGGWDQLLARQREIDQQTPWAPKKIAGPAVQTLPQAPSAPSGQRPAWEDALRADPSGQTPEGAAALDQMWGLDQVRDQLDQRGLLLDKSGKTPEDAAGLKKMWGIDQIEEELRRRGLA